ncbi:MAG: spermidine/putrescine ABC transporter substrate-binding protein [Ruminococcaceae bacterium]|nr:spermidine/putrescine ABC transporter substrate-binding protein [Oscillospiraceae bacterium]
MKRFLALLSALLMLLVFSSCAAPDDEPIDDEEEDVAWDYQAEFPKAAPTGVTINVYNWGEYIDDEILDVNAAFTYVTGIEVNYKTFENNESMYALISSGAADYDVIIPSDYMVGKMIDEGMLRKLNFDNIPNYQYIGENYRNLNYDPENAYSVPYTWGTVGIFYNTKYVDEADLALGWDLLWCDKYKDRILMFNNPRDAFGVALMKNGHSLNTTDPAHWNAAFDALVEQKQVLYKYVNDEIYDLMIGETCWIAPYYAGDGVLMIYEEGANEDIAFFIPESGTNFFVDAMCVRSTSKHPAEAEAYINFMCNPHVAAANAEYIGYSCPEPAAMELMDPEITENPYFYPPQSILDRTEIFLTLPKETNKLQADLWLKLKQITRK